VLGIDICEIAGSTFRKLLANSQEIDFKLPIPPKQTLILVNTFMNAYCSMARPNHTYRDFINVDCTSGEEQRKIEKEIYKNENLS